MAFLKVDRTLSKYPLFYRKDLNDLDVFKEVFVRKCYRRSGIDFDVEPGEIWLDLGGHIGSFVLYCASKGASVDSYEPHPDCFGVLKRNAEKLPNATVSRFAVTHLKGVSMVNLHLARSKSTMTRSSCCPTVSMRNFLIVPNLYIGNLLGPYDGIKMDIEGSEFGILDNDVLPPCRKLVMEYHTSRDQSTDNLRRRLDYLKSKFSVVKYPAELDRIANVPNSSVKTYYDRLIHCIA